MLRGIDTQVMLQQTVNAARVAGEKAHESDQAKEFQAQLEQERAVEEMDTVQNTQAAEHRRVEEDQDGQAEADWRFEQQHRQKRPPRPRGSFSSFRAQACRTTPAAYPAV